MVLGSVWPQKAGPKFLIEDGLKVEKDSSRKFLENRENKKKSASEVKLTLSLKSEFRAFFGEHQTYRLKFLTVLRVPAKEDLARVGISIKGKGIRGVDREKMRRQIREAFRKSRPSLGRYHYFFILNDRHGQGRAFLSNLKKILPEAISFLIGQSGKL